MQRELTDFQQDVIEASHKQPVLVDFWAPWCGPCRYLGPTLERLAEAAGSRWCLVKINVDEHAAIAARYGVQSIPAVKLFQDGAVVVEFVGALPELQVRRWLEEHIPTAGARKLEQAREALAAGDAAAAHSLLQEVLSQDPESDEARVLLARLQFEKDPAASAELVSQIGPESRCYDLAQAIVMLARLLALSADDKERLMRQEAGALYLQGIRALGDRRYKEALEAWVEVVRRDRRLDDDGARRACVALFAWLGQDHPLTVEYRSKLGAALY